MYNCEWDFKLFKNRVTKVSDLRTDVRKTHSDEVAPLPVNKQNNLA